MVKSEMCQTFRDEPKWFTVLGDGGSDTKCPESESLNIHYWNKVAIIASKKNIQ